MQIRRYLQVCVLILVHNMCTNKMHRQKKKSSMYYYQYHIFCEGINIYGLNINTVKYVLHILGNSVFFTDHIKNLYVIIFKINRVYPNRYLHIYFFMCEQAHGILAIILCAPVVNVAPH